jgi:type VI secretion system protein ImpA
MTLPTSLPVDAELGALLEPISESAESGADLDGTLELSAFEMTVREPEAPSIAGVEWQDERDWRAIESTALKLLAKSKDLRIAVQLARARCQTQGLPAFCDVVRFICELAQRHWTSVYPRLDAEGAEPTARLNALEELTSPPLLDQLRRARLAVVPGLGPVTIKEAIASTIGGSKDAKRVRAVLDALGPDAVEQHLAQLRATREALAQLGAFVLEQSKTAVRIKQLVAPKGERPAILDVLETLFAEAQQRHAALSVAAAGGAAADAVAATGSANAMPGAHPGVIASRSDVIATLDRVCDYYTATEPSSPVPLLLRRAQRLVPMDFLALVRDLAQERVVDIAKTAGLDPEPPRPDAQGQQYADNQFRADAQFNESHHN